MVDLAVLHKCHGIRVALGGEDGLEGGGGDGSKGSRGGGRGAGHRFGW